MIDQTSYTILGDFFLLQFHQNKRFAQHQTYISIIAPAHKTIKNFRFSHY